jgi:branched-chain amino acid aminotransferase
VFIVKNGVLVTPQLTASVLESITRETVMELARDELGLRVEERDIDRTEIYMADEAFICGSAVEVVPIIQLDRFSLSGGKAGVVTSRLLELYLNCVRGEVEKYRRWITKIA